MPYETKPNTGSLFVNDRKTSEKHPDRTGSVNIDGKEYWLNGWLKESKKGVKYLSLALSPKDDQEQRATPEEEQTPF